MQSYPLAAGASPAMRFVALTLTMSLVVGCSSSSDSSPDDNTSGTLAPLPDPPLSQGPSADDTPVPFDAVLHTVTDYALVRDTGPRIEQQGTASDFNEADFAAGLPEAEVQRPQGLDPASNSAPYFEGLANVRVQAGELVEIAFVPRDPEGELPGMYPQELPEGASFDDNFDGSKTLRWQTYQADIGINAFTAVAVDPAEGQYRTSQTVLIAVEPPSDPASVPNIAPTIEDVSDYTVRVGDPISIFFQGIDRNGTVPTLELVDPPAGAILTPDPRTPSWRILQAVAPTPGEFYIDILARDAEDSQLTTTTRITLTAVDPQDVEPTGRRLKDAAAQSGIAFGSAISPVFYMQADGGLYESVAASEFALITPESSMKWDAINPLPGRFEFADMDNLISFAEFNGMQVRGHPLVWHRSLPEWVLDTPAANREIIMREYITRVMTRYRDAIDYWDVINEPLADNGSLRDSLWSQAMGEDYIDVAFRQARALDPEAVLVLNEYDISFAGPKFDALLALIDRLQARDVPLDAIGMQMHVFATFNQYDELASNMAAIAERGLDIHITELDVASVSGSSSAAQAEVYRRVVETCLAQARCTVLQTWGFTDRYSFRTFNDPLYFDRSYQAKPAYQALQQALGGG